MTIHSQFGGHAMRSLELRDEALTQLGALEVLLEQIKAGLRAVSLESTPRDDVATAHRVRRLLKARRSRSHFFDPALFADPAWDILLEAFSAHLLKERTCVTALCNAAAVPSTTALRWLTKLVDDGLLIRCDDARDRRRSWVEISPMAASTMHRFFGETAVWLPV